MAIRQFKAISALFFVTGLLWLTWNWWFGLSITPCLLKNITGLPCPGCGSTRAAVLALEFKFAAAAALNPLGLLYASAIIVLPIWFIYDLYFRTNTMFIAWNNFEKKCKRAPVFLLLSVLIGIVWIHNIITGL